MYACMYVRHVMVYQRNPLLIMCCSMGLVTQFMIKRPWRIEKKFFFTFVAMKNLIYVPFAFKVSAQYAKYGSAF